MRPIEPQYSSPSSGRNWEANCSVVVRRSQKGKQISLVDSGDGTLQGLSDKMSIASKSFMDPLLNKTRNEAYGPDFCFDMYFLDLQNCEKTSR